jgi:hypothetical protein
MENNTGTRAGTIGGTLLTLFANIHREDIAKTIILAAIGAVISFIVSNLLKVLFLYIKKFNRK